ncbi:hypothetical protein EXIGLDRAFT_839540 [Exidia glandulosa HHB12029]|uniref:Uncharacterized protein n=1 Tax=Exidia glandulosa HHB12029 TaxID=1314781 RepID=A0A165EZA9_EXIGL|nr:hypothetical protein EXIGLDRAFT_839540 [Exidia glandulosa HHB12029]
MSGLMDFVSGLMAASSAGKLPSTKQANDMAEWLLKSPLIQIEQSAAGSGGKLSEQGEAVARDVREIVQAYQAAAVQKNGDDILQDALFELTRAQTDTPNKDPAMQDGRELVGAAKLMLEVLLGGSGELGGEMASFTRLTTADVAEAIEGQAGAAKDKLRQTEDEVQAGKRDALGRTQDDAHGEADARQTFERRMDTIKNVGGQTIGTGQDVKGRSQDIKDNLVERLDNATFRIAERAQNDPDYRRSVDTIFSIYRKYLDRSIDTAQDVKSRGDTDIEAQIADIVQDPTGRVQESLRKLRTLVERFAGGHSLNNLLIALSACAADIREDRDVRAWWDEYERFVRKSMDEPGYLRSEEREQRRRELYTRWDELKAVDTDAGRKWAKDLERVQRESTAFGEAVKADGDMQRLKDAHVALGKHLLGAAPTAGKALIGQAGWVWADVAEVLIPRLFSILKEIPLPRTEFVDPDTEFVLENMSLQSLQVLPGHVKISHTTNVEIDAPKTGETERDTSTKTRIQFTGLQITLKEVAFWYHDKGKLPVDTVTGLLDVKIPEKGVDMDVTLGLLPTASGSAERRKRGGFHNIESVKASLDDVTVAIRESNHQIMISMFKPVFRTALVKAVRQSLENYMRVALEALDGMAYDVHHRARVFADAGTPLGPAYVSGLVSQLGYMAKQEVGILDGVRATSVGVIKDDPNSKSAFAVGAAPQLIGADKRAPGPAGKKGKWEQGATPSVEGFTEAVARKRDAEKKGEGWRSNAFDLPPYARSAA